MKNNDIEQQLFGLNPCKAPENLREQILSQFDQAEPLVPAHMKRLSFETYTNVAVALLLLVALAMWTVNIMTQQRRLARLLGPTPARLQAERIVEAMDMYASESDKATELNRLCLLLQSASRAESSVRSIHSLANVRLGPILDNKAFFNFEESVDETDRKNPAEHNGNSSRHRGGNELDFIRTA